MKAPKTITTLYALIIFFGGCVGYYKAHSTPSLIFAAISTALLLFFAYRMSPNRKYPLYGAIAIIVLLDAFFSYRFMHSLKFFPSGMMSLISLIALFAFALTAKKAR